MQVALMGRAEVTGSRASVPVRAGRPTLLLAALVLDRPRSWTRDELFDLLWPVGGPADLAHALRLVVSRTRAALVEAGALGPAILARGGSVRLDLGAEPLSVDVEDALELLASAEAAGYAQAWTAAAEAGQRALEALAEPFVVDGGTAWARAWRERLETAQQRALLATAMAARNTRQFARAIELADIALAADSYDERFVRLAMESYERAGQRAAALGVYERCRKLLDDELGIRPSPQTAALHLRLLGEAPEAPARAEGIAPRGAEELVRLHVGSAPFVGRANERRVLDDAWRAARAGARRIAVVRGEAGIGKTRLAAEIANRAGTEAVVAWGRFLATGSGPFQPFTEVAAQLVAQDPELLSRLGPAASDLAPILSLSTPAGLHADAYTRARLFHAIGELFRLAARRPMLVVFDDLQWAGTDALALLVHVLDALASGSCLVVATARELDGPAATTVAELRRLDDAIVIELEGFSATEVGELLTRNEVRTAGVLGDVAAALRHRTDGNPLYVTQFVREAQSTDAPVDPGVVPAAVTEVLTGRFATLPEAAVRLLELAAVIGNEFDLRLLEACAALPADRMLDIVDDLCRRRVLEERGAERFAFAHDLVRDAVLHGVGATRRARLHGRVASALAEGGAEAAAIAYHYTASGASGEALAASWHVRAGDDALSRAAWSDALDQYEQVSHLNADGRDLVAAQIGTGRARRALGDVAGAREVLERALSRARADGLADLQAAATLALVGGGGRGVALDLDDSARADLLRAARAGLDDTHPALLVQVLGELALALVLTDQIDERNTICDQCLRAADRWNDPAALAFALLTRRIARMGPEGTLARAADTQRILALPPDAVPVEHQLAAELARVEDGIELGDRATVRTALAHARELADRVRHPHWSWAAACWQVLDAMIDGEFDAVEALAQAAFALQAGPDHPEAAAAFGVQLVDLRLFEGRAAEVVPLLAGAAEANEQIPTYRAVLGLACAEAGDEAGARAVLDWFAARDYLLPPDSNWLLGTAVLADAAATLGDARAATVLAVRLAPFADRHVVLNCYGGGGAYWGPVSYHLGRLAACCGDRDGARRALDEARRAAEAFGATAFGPRIEAARAEAG